MYNTNTLYYECNHQRMLTTTEITATKQIKWERDPLRT